MLDNFAFIGFGVPGFLIVIIIAIIVIFEIAMFINVIRNNNITSNTRLLWIIGMLIIHPFVAIAYYLTDYKKSL
jgi:predicted membrane protein